jgi:AAA domain-containing protein/bifunctional DNA primase/polymerase-like protein
MEESMDQWSTATRLASMGVPIVGGALGPHGEPLWNGWDKAVADPSRVEALRREWKPGWGLAAVTGHAFDWIDIDPRNGGEESWEAIKAELRGETPTVYGEALTRSGGRHLLIAPLGLAKGTNIRPGVDYQGGQPNGEGRALAFIPPTVRPARHDPEPKPYAWVRLPELPTPGDTTGQALKALILASRVAQGEGHTGYSNPSIHRLIEEGVPLGGQHDVLRDMVWKAVTNGATKQEAHILYDEVISRTPLANPADKWTGRDFALLYESADRKVNKRKGSRLEMRALSEVTFKPIRWLWDTTEEGEPRHWGGRLQSGILAMLTGRADRGKGQFCTWLLTQITNGTLPGCYYGRPKGVAWVTSEDSVEKTIGPRFEFAGADMRRVYHLRGATIDGEGYSMVLPHDIEELADLIDDYDLGAIVLDPLLSVMGDGSDFVSKEVRKNLEPLAAMLDRMDCLCLGIAHNKKGKGNDALLQMANSTAFGDVPRAVMSVDSYKDDEDVTTHVMSQVKNNEGRADLPSLAYTFESGYVMSEGQQCHTSRLVWTGVSPFSVEDILSDRVTPEFASQIERCRVWLEYFLTSEMPSQAVRDEAKREGYTMPVLTRARKAARVITRQRDSRDKPTSTWKLPPVIKSL